MLERGPEKNTKKTFLSLNRGLSNYRRSGVLSEVERYLLASLEGTGFSERAFYNEMTIRNEFLKVKTL